MPIDYVVIEPVRQHFGDSPTGADPESAGGEEPLDLDEPNAPWLGPEYPYPFDCPGVDANQWSVLTFNTFGVSIRTDVVKVNGTDIPGGIYPTAVSAEFLQNRATWNTELLLVPAGVLKDAGNWLYFQSNPIRPQPNEEYQDRDDFIVDNVVLWFKLRTTAKPPVGSSES